MSQEHLFYDTPEDAIDTAIKDSSLSYKEIAIKLWPSLKMDTAYARLKAGLSQDKPEKLSFGEILLICKLTGHFDPIYFACDELSLHRPAVKAPADEKAQLLLSINRQQENLLAAFKRLERIAQ